MEHCTKAAEKQAIRDLWNMGGYFHDMIDAEDIHKMLDNIDDDFALECGTFIDKQRSENEKLAKRYDNLSESYDNAVEALEEERDKNEALTKEILRLKMEFLKIKVMEDEPLSKEDKELFIGMIRKINE